ncbi:MAG: Lon-like protease helical domain-containing protein, partial [Planctomycetota bacterium]
MPRRPETRPKATEPPLSNDGRIAADATIPVPRLRWRCDTKLLDFASTMDIEPADGVVGQAIAIEALEFGLQTSAPGQHIFVRGLTGTGRTTLLHRLLKSMRPQVSESQDCCYVQNFRQSDRPTLITLPRGCGRRFRKKVDRLAEFIRSGLPEALDSPGFRARKSALEQALQQRVETIGDTFNRALREAGLAIASRQAGKSMQTYLVPVLEGEGPISLEDFEQRHGKSEISDEAYQAFQEKRRQFEPQFEEVRREIMQVNDKIRAELDALIEREARSVLAEEVARVEQEFAQPEVRRYLADLVDDVIEHAFADDEQQDRAHLARRYRVNVL